MPHVILDLDEAHDPTKRDMTVRVDPDDATIFEIRDQDGGPLVGLGYLAVLSAPNLFRCGAFPVIAERLFPTDPDDPADPDDPDDLDDLDAE